MLRNKGISVSDDMDGPLKPGVTHVLKPAGAKGKAKLVRKRFSAI